MIDVKMINDDMTVRDLVVSFPQTREVLDRHKVDYCCGGHRDLRGAAKAAGAPLEALLAELRAAAAAPAARRGEDTDWSSASLTKLARHVEDRHHAFMKRQLPRINDLLNKVLKAHGARHGRMLESLRKVFQGLSDEIQMHLMKEEQVLFPCIAQLQAAADRNEPPPPMHCGSVQNPIRQMELEHENAGAALAEMRRITADYRLPADACETFAALYDALSAVEADLHEHIHLENNILFPRAVELEESSGRPARREA